MPPNRTSKKIACDACHGRKIQCDATEEVVDGRKQPCDWCLHHKIPCTFNRIRGRRKNTIRKATESVDLAERLARVEEALALGQFATRLSELRESEPPTESSDTATGSSAQASTSSPALSQAKSAASSSLNPQVNVNPPAHPPRASTISASPSAWNTNESGSTPASVSTPFTPTSNAHESYAQIHFAGAHLGHLSSRDGTPLFSAQGERWIKSRTGEAPRFTMLQDAKQQKYHSYTSALLSGGSGAVDLELPPRSLAQTCIDAFANSPFRLAFPVIDMVLMEETLRSAYSTEDLPELRRETSKACIFAFLSITNLAFQDGGDSPIENVDEWAVKAQHFLPDVLQSMTITALEALFMMFLHQMFAGRYQPGTMFHSLATRTVFALGGHHNVTGSSIDPNQGALSERMARHLRNLFWLCYIFDKDIALRTGQPPLITDEDCDLTIPEGYIEQMFRYKEEHSVWSQHHFDNVVPHLPADIRLNLIKAKTCRLLYSPSSLKKSEAELVRDIRMLDADLEAWRISMPKLFQPTLSIPRNLTMFDQPMLPNGMNRVIIYFEYFYLLAAIHRASGRCRAPAPGDGEGADDGMMVFGVTSSIELGVEASRSTLLFMRAVMHELHDNSFWCVMFYPMSAIITLFCNMLIDPLSESSREDLQIIESAVTLVRAMLIRKKSTDELRHIQSVNEFMDELMRMANCAVAKAERDRATRGAEMELDPQLI